MSVLSVGNLALKLIIGKWAVFSTSVGVRFIKSSNLKCCDCTAEVEFDLKSQAGAAGSFFFFAAHGLNSVYMA